MEDLKAVAWMVRYGARSLGHNLDFIPADRANWKPEPGVKSPLEIATEVLRALRIYLPIFHGPEYPDPRPPLPQPATLEDLDGGGTSVAGGIETAFGGRDRGLGQHHVALESLPVFAVGGQLLWRWPGRDSRGPATPRSLEADAG